MDKSNLFFLKTDWNCREIKKKEEEKYEYKFVIRDELF